MPIYEYECPECSHRFEKLMRISAEPPPCPECSHAEVRKLVSASGFILKGGGWYKDHYGLKGGSSKSSSSDSSSSGSSASASGSSSSDS
jgi:putative FmdB family regulatory protein